MHAYAGDRGIVAPTERFDQQAAAERVLEKFESHVWKEIEASGSSPLSSWLWKRCGELSLYPPQWINKAIEHILQRQETEKPRARKPNYSTDHFRSIRIFLTHKLTVHLRREHALQLPIGRDSEEITGELFLHLDKSLGRDAVHTQCRKGKKFFETTPTYEDYWFFGIDVEGIYKALHRY